MAPTVFTVTVTYDITNPSPPSYPGTTEFVAALGRIQAAHPELLTLAPVGNTASPIFARSPKFTLTASFVPEIEPAFFSQETYLQAWDSFLNRIFWVPQDLPRIIGQFSYTVDPLPPGVNPGPGTGGSGGGDK